MKICEKCKEINADTSAVCKKCGEVLPVTETWAASLRKGARVDAPATAKHTEAEKRPGERIDDAAPWGATLAGMGLTLTLCAFLAGVMNAGLVFSLGAALSVGAIIRINAERRPAEGAWMAALLSLLIFAVCMVVYIAIFQRELYPH